MSPELLAAKSRKRPEGETSSQGAYRRTGDLRRRAAALLCLFAAILSGPQRVLAAQAPVLVPVANDPTVSVRLWFKVGAQDDPPGKEGLAALTAAMLTEAATQQHGYDQILDRLFPLASGYGASSSMEMTVVSGRTHVDNLADFYPLLRDAVLAPAFKPEDLERLRSRALNQVENQLRFASDEELGKAVLYHDVFGGTPYGHLEVGTVASLKGVTLDDVRAFYAKHFTRDNVVIGLGGAIPRDAGQPTDRAVAPITTAPGQVNAANVLEQLKRDLNQLPPGAPTPVPAPAPKPLKGVSVTLVEKNTASTAISIGFPLEIVRGAREWYALAIANSWLGEHRNSSGRLYQVIREQRGLNYGDYAYIEHYPNGGARMTPPQNVARRRQLFEIWIRPVPHEARHFALRAALREVDQLIKHGLTPAQFEERREFLKKYVLHYASTTSERLGYAIDDAFYGLAEPHLDRYRRLMDEITLDEVNAAIRKHWQLANMKIAIVTQGAAALADALVANAPSPITYSSPKTEAVLAADKEIATFPLSVAREAVKIVPVTELFAK